MTDKVNHPDHYGGDTTYEVIKVIHAWELGFDLGNAVKYIARAGKKDPDKHIEDLKKAVFYINDEIARLSPSWTKPDMGPKCSCGYMHIPGGTTAFREYIHHLSKPCFVRDPELCYHESNGLFCTKYQGHPTLHGDDSEGFLWDGIKGNYPIVAENQPGMIGG